MVISMAKGQSTHAKENAVIFTTYGDAKSWHGRLFKMINMRKCLLDGSDGWDTSADILEWDSIPISLKK